MAQAVNRDDVQSVLDKLSSLRKTLSDEEQEILDGVLVVEAAELNLHAFTADGALTDTFSIDIDPDTGRYIAVIPGPY